MRFDLFRAFADTVASLPPRAVIRTLDLQARMLQDDLIMKRPVPPNQTQSVISFCLFIAAAKIGGPAPVADVLPLEHLAFYRQTVWRLIDAGELPSIAGEQFDCSFPARAKESLFSAA